MSAEISIAVLPRIL